MVVVKKWTHGQKTSPWNGCLGPIECTTAMCQWTLCLKRLHTMHRHRRIINWLLSHKLIGQMIPIIDWAEVSLQLTPWSITSCNKTLWHRNWCEKQSELSRNQFQNKWTKIKTKGVTATAVNIHTYVNIHGSLTSCGHYGGAILVLSIYY